METTAHLNGVHLRGESKTTEARASIIEHHDRAFFAHAITESWRQQIESILATGRLLQEAKKNLAGEYEKMVREDLPFGRSTAHRLRKIALHPVLSDMAHGPYLPACWRTLYELTKMPEARLLEAIAEKTVHPEMERTEALELLLEEAEEFGTPPDPPDQPVSKRGDVIYFREVDGTSSFCHGILVVGDAGDPADMDKLVGERRVDLVYIDPPYNVGATSRSNNARATGLKGLPARARKKEHLQGFDNARHGKKPATHRKMRAKDRVLANDFLTPKQYRKKLRAWFGNFARVLRRRGVFYVWGGYINWQDYCPAMKKCGLYFSQGITWVKNNPVLGGKHFMNDAEHAWYGWKKGGGHACRPPTNATNVWQVKKVPHRHMVHLTEKPVELASKAIAYSSRTGDFVLDSFAGSGSTLMAVAKQNHLDIKDAAGRPRRVLIRRALLLEIDEAYVDAICERWQRSAPGRTAIYADGVTFDQRRDQIQVNVAA